MLIGFKPVVPDTLFSTIKKAKVPGGKMELKTLNIKVASVRFSTILLFTILSLSLVFLIHLTLYYSTFLVCYTNKTLYPTANGCLFL